MKGVRHPFTGALYEPDGNGHVVVSMDGRSGLFTHDGRWLSGEIRECDPQLCGWVGGSRSSSHRVTTRPRDNGNVGGNGGGRSNGNGTITKN